MAVQPGWRRTWSESKSVWTNLFQLFVVQTTRSPRHHQGPSEVLPTPTSVTHTTALRTHAAMEIHVGTPAIKLVIMGKYSGTFSSPIYSYQCNAYNCAPYPYGANTCYNTCYQSEYLGTYNELFFRDLKAESGENINNRTFVSCF